MPFSNYAHMHTQSCSQTKGHGHWSGSETSAHGKSHMVSQSIPWVVPQLVGMTPHRYGAAMVASATTSAQDS